jgi:MFS family permease
MNSMAAQFEDNVGSSATMRSAPWSAWIAFALTFGLMMSDYISRQVLLAVFPFLRSAWGLSDTQLGSLVSIVALMVGVLSIPISFAADRWGRVKSIAAMACLWSLATIACGLAANYGQMFAARTVIGIGEAAYATAGGAILMHAFPPKLRSTVMGIFLAGALFGSVIGVALGGIVATRIGWQWAFISVGVPGFLLALLYPLLVRDYETVTLVKNDNETAAAEEQKMSFREIAKASLGVRSTVYAYFGGALQLFASAAIVAWIPSYLNRFYALTPEQAAVKAALIVLVGGIGMAGGGFVADRLSVWDVRNKLRVPALYAICSCLLLAAAFALPESNLQFALIAAGTLFVGAHMGPVAALSVELNHPGLRATALSVVTLVYNFVGLAPGPFVVGALSDAFGLRAAMMVIPLVCLGAAICFLLGSRHLPENWRRFHPNLNVESAHAAKA